MTVKFFVLKIDICQNLVKFIIFESFYFLMFVDSFDHILRFKFSCNKKKYLKFLFTNLTSIFFMLKTDSFTLLNRLHQFSSYISFSLSFFLRLNNSKLTSNYSLQVILLVDRLRYLYQIFYDLKPFLPFQIV